MGRKLLDAKFQGRAIIVIPARFASTRLPGKPLADILGKPMIQHVYERAIQVPMVTEVIVATDDDRVGDAVIAFGGQCVMTSQNHSSGTDRLIEVMSKHDAEIFINLQGDEPMVRPSDIAKLVTEMCRDSSIQVGTLCHFFSAQEAVDQDAVKVVLSDNGDALYFSRSVIPNMRDAQEGTRYLKHVGIYAYRREALMKFSNLPLGSLEQTEKLEQLRFLSAGVPIRVFEIDPVGPSVDTQESLENVRVLMSGTEITKKITLADVRLVITDVDGVLTDGGLYYSENGESIKRFHVRDGLGIRMLEKCGIRVAVVSSRDSPTLRRRVADLGVSLFEFGVNDKAVACQNIIQKVGVSSDETVCIGDDSIDLPAFEVCGISYAVSDAPIYVKSKASGILNARGGDGAFRELADAILVAQGKSYFLETAHEFSKLMNNTVQ